MIIHETKIRVRYGETDQMGYVYHGNYAQYYEIGRTELMRSFGLSYDELEKSGILLPVISLNAKFIKPGRYDDLLTIKTTVKEMPTVKIHFNYDVINEKDEIISSGETTLVFVDAKTRKPMRAPKDFLERIRKSMDETQ